MLEAVPCRDLHLHCNGFNIQSSSLIILCVCDNGERYKDYLNTMLQRGCKMSMGSELESFGKNKHNCFPLQNDTTKKHGISTDSFPSTTYKSFQHYIKQSIPSFEHK